MFADVENVQDPGAAMNAERQIGLVNESGIRTAQPTGRRVFFGTTLGAPQRFSATPSPVNFAESINVAVVSGSTAARMVNKTRGRVEAPGARS